jgi:hypothetical protein
MSKKPFKVQPSQNKQFFDVTAKKKTYSIEFATTTTGILQSVNVTLEVGTLADDEIANIDLRDHPLYPSLQQYVLRNPVFKA